jgi:hypothetical protein
VRLLPAALPPPPLALASPAQPCTASSLQLASGHPPPPHRRRVALPLGTVAGGGSVIVSSDLRRPHRATTFWATTGEASLAGRSLKEGRTAVADGPG